MTNNSNYLSAILLLGLPILVLQWVVGLDIFWRRWRVWVTGTLLPAGYMTVIYWLGARRANLTQTLGGRLPLVDAPLEDMLFYGVVSLLTIQGLMLAMYFPLVVKRVQSLAAQVRRGPVWLRRRRDTASTPFEETDPTNVP